MPSKIRVEFYSRLSVSAVPHPQIQPIVGVVVLPYVFTEKKSAYN